jgi:hypothetical protein
MRVVLLLAALAPAFAQGWSRLAASSQPVNITAVPNSGTATVTAPAGCLWIFNSDTVG